MKLHFESNIPKANLIKYKELLGRDITRSIRVRGTISSDLKVSRCSDG